MPGVSSFLSLFASRDVGDVWRLLSPVAARIPYEPCLLDTAQGYPRYCASRLMVLPLSITASVWADNLAFRRAAHPMRSVGGARRGGVAEKVPQCER